MRRERGLTDFLSIALRLRCPPNVQYPVYIKSDTFVTISKYDTAPMASAITIMASTFLYGVSSSSSIQ